MDVPARGVAPEWARPTLFFGEKDLAKGSAIEAVTDVARRVTEGRGFDLVDVEVKNAPGGRLVRLYVDRPGGIGLDDLQSVSEEISAVLDVEDPLSGSYTLEVSSPGLDRPLKDEADFRRAVGRLVKVSSYEPLDGRRHWLGRLRSVADGVAEVMLEKEGGALVRLPLDRLAHGRLEPEFKR
jgi:ribosome maturation factor RimP